MGRPKLNLTPEEYRQRRTNAVKRWRHKNPDKVKLWSKKYTESRYLWRIRKEYGLTKEAYYKLLEQQASSCAICGKSDLKLVIDHCHAAGHVRGLLCNLCNVGLGSFSDDPNRLRLADMYLERNGPGLPPHQKG